VVGECAARVWVREAVGAGGVYDEVEERGNGIGADSERERGGGRNSNFCDYILMERFFGCEIGHREPEREGERRCPIEDDVE
jgi:hypothetical protein